MNGLMKAGDANIVEVRNANLDKESLVAVVPAGEIHLAAEYGHFRPPALSADLPVLSGYFPAWAFGYDDEPTIGCDFGLTRLLPGTPPLLTFSLQVGASMACWFANPTDEEVWEMLAQWKAQGTMALAANLEAGRVLWGIKPFTIPDEYFGPRRLESDARERITHAYLYLMARLYADGATRQVAVPCLADYPVLLAAHMNTVRTERTCALSIPADDLPVGHPLRRMPR